MVKISGVNMQQRNQNKIEFERKLLFFASLVKVGKIIGQFIALQIWDIFKKILCKAQCYKLQSSEAVCKYLTPSNMSKIEQEDRIWISQSQK